MRALVAGGGGAFGSAIAAALRDRGWTVVTTDRTGSVDVVADVSRDDCVPVLREAAGERLDLLVYSAGVGLVTDIGTPPDAGARTTLEVNLFGAWRATGACLPSLLAARGRTAVAAVLAATPPLATAAYPLLPLPAAGPLPDAVAVLAATHLAGLLVVALTAADHRRTM